MDQAVLERTYSFDAVHHYRNPGWSEEENRAAFGELAAPHPHRYRVTIRVTGPMDPFTGFCVDLSALDAAVETLLAPLRSGDLNASIPAFASGDLLPSCENLARWLFRALGEQVPGPARLTTVRVAESGDLWAEYPGA